MKLKKLKIKIKGWLLVKLASLRKDNRILRAKIADNVIEMQKVNDAITTKDRLIRDLLLKLDDDTRKMWLKEYNYERYFDKKKPIKK